jgi:hypothetical protein
MQFVIVDGFGGRQFSGGEYDRRGCRPGRRAVIGTDNILGRLADKAIMDIPRLRIVRAAFECIPEDSLQPFPAIKDIENCLEQIRLFLQVDLIGRIQVVVILADGMHAPESNFADQDGSIPLFGKLFQPLSMRDECLCQLLHSRIRDTRQIKIIGMDRNGIQCIPELNFPQRIFLTRPLAKVS